MSRSNLILGMATLAFGTVMFGCVTLKSDLAEGGKRESGVEASVDATESSGTKVATAPVDFKGDLSKTKPWVESNHKMAVQLASSILTDQPSTNFLLSPQSIATVGTILREAASPEADQVLARLLGQTQQDKAVDVSGLRYAQKEFTEFDKELSKQEILRQANGLWIDSRSVRRDFARSIARNYNADVQRLPRSGTEAAREINRWVSDQTEKMVPSLFPELSDNTVLVLVNTLIFDDKWDEPWQTVAEQEFSLGDGKKIMIPMMKRANARGYTKGSNFEAVEAQYRSGLRMRFYLPNLATSLKEMVVSKEFSESLQLNLSPAKGTILGPKWNSDFTFGLADYWKKNDGQILFSPGKELFPKAIEGQSWIERAIHKTTIRVDESGTVAAAASGAGLAKSTDLPGEEEKPFEVTLNRPFVYVIWEPKSKNILLFGAVTNPLQ